VLVITVSEALLTPIKYGRFLTDQIANAAIVNIEDSGHLSPVEKPDDVVQAIRAFIRTQ
jgi:pimeloyl-ACP methyl ester carboxylesterase